MLEALFLDHSAMTVLLWLPGGNLLKSSKLGYNSSVSLVVGWWAVISNPETNTSVMLVAL